MLFSDTGGWTATDQGRLEALAAVGAVAVGVDTDAYLARLASVAARCDQLVGDVEDLSRQLLREYPGAGSFSPILAGVGKGGALAGAILAQTPAAAVGGAISIDPWGALRTNHQFCPRAPSSGDGGKSQFWPVPILNAFWIVALTPAAPIPTRAHFETLQTLS